MRNARHLGWPGRRPALNAVFDTTAATAAELDHYAIPFGLYSSPGGAQAWEHLRQLTEARRLNPERWEMVYQDAGYIPEISLFKLQENDVKSANFGDLLALNAPRSLE